MHIVPGTDFITIGRIAKVHGIGGAVVMISEKPFRPEILETEQLFIRIDGLAVPFFLSSLEMRNETTFVLEFDWVSSRSEAERLVGCDVMLEQKKKKGRPSKKITEASIIGYTVIDKKYGKIGTLIEVLEYPNNSVFKIAGKKEILVPVHEDIILHVNDSEKEIYISAAEGLIDLYLEG